MTLEQELAALNELYRDYRNMMHDVYYLEVDAVIEDNKEAFEFYNEVQKSLRKTKIRIFNRLESLKEIQRINNSMPEGHLNNESD